MRLRKGHLIVLLIGLIMLIFGLISQGAGNIHSLREWIRILSNAALFPGVLLTGLGLIVLISEEGFFDGIRYSMNSLITHMRHGSKRYASFYDYTKREKKAADNPLLLPGLFYLVIAVILTMIYYIVPS